MRNEINNHPEMELLLESLEDFTRSSLVVTMQDEDKTPGNVKALIISMDDEMKSSEIMKGLGLA